MAVARPRADSIHVFGTEAERPRGVAHGAAPLVGVDIADQRGVLDAVARIDISDDLIPPRGGEVEIDIRRGVAAVAEETLEQQIVRQRIDRGDAEDVSDDGVGGRAAALTADALAAGEAHDIPDDQEVVRQPDSLDDGQLVAELAHGAWGDGSVFFTQPGVRQRIQVTERRFTRWPSMGEAGCLRREGGCAVSGEVERDRRRAAAFGDFERGVQRHRQIGEQCRHLGRRLEAEFGRSLGRSLKRRQFGGQLAE